MFVKDDYIVNLKVNHSQFRLNHIFKQRETTDILRPYIDCERLNNNGLGAISFDRENVWRYAEPHEIEAYEYVREPVDVTLLKKPYTSQDLINSLEKLEEKWMKK